MRFFSSGSLFAFLAGVVGLHAADPVAWKPADRPLLTRWAKDVSPDHVLPEYPRPQMVRPQWTNLNGLWDYAVTPKDAVSPPAAYDGKILVPFPIEAPLSGVNARSSRMNTCDPKPGPAPANSHRTPVVDEFGGLFVPAEGHDWPGKIFGYDQPKTPDEFTGKYVGLIEQVCTLRDHDGLAGAIYTQLTDVELECSGLLSYDRAVIHPDAARAAAANRSVQTAP